MLGLRFSVSKIIKIIKIIKKEKKAKNKGYGTRFARVVSKAKARSKALIMYSLRSYFLKSKSFKVRTLPGCSVLTIENQKGACNQGKNWRNFYSVQSLVDTRLVNSIRAFVYAFIVELMHQRKHRHFASLRLKTMIVQARFARPSWTSGFLVL